VPVKSAVDLLRAVVDAEDAGIQHAEQCVLCQIGARVNCSDGLQLAMTSVEAMLEAKVWLTENQGVAA
jgi:hypothetical protein